MEGNKDGERPDLRGRAEFTRLVQLKEAEGCPHGYLHFPHERKQREVLISALQCPCSYVIVHILSPPCDLSVNRRVLLLLLSPQLPNSVFNQV